MKLCDYPWWGSWAPTSTSIKAGHVSAHGAFVTCRLDYKGLHVIAEYRGKTVTMMIQAQTGLDADCLTKLKTILLQYRGKPIQQVDAIDFSC